VRAPLRDERRRAVCGLSALVDPGCGTGGVEALIAMHTQIPHRGPDGEGFSGVRADGQVVTAPEAAVFRAGLEGVPLRAAFGFRWLQIQDRSREAAQPMVAADNSIQLIFNGEIYNFRALRRELASLGHRFRSESDTEVVLAGYAQWGVEVFARLEGMWAMAILDVAASRMIVSRDRFGIKPLFYAFDGARLLFASEVKQLLAAGISRSGNGPAVRRFIHGARPAEAEQSFFSAIRAVPPASYADVDLACGGPLKFESYWQLHAAKLDRPDFEQASRELERVLAESVADHLVSVVPMGVLVSGGLDSSLVSALSTKPFRDRGERGAGFSMVLDRGHGHLDESAQIRRLVEAFDLRGFSAELTPEWLKQHLPAVTHAQEEPVAGIAVAGQFLAYQLAASTGTRVVLDGQGADELFGGYPRHQVSYLRDCLGRRAFLRALAESTAIAARNPGFFRDMWKHSRFGPRRDSHLFPVAERSSTSPDLASLDATLRRDVLQGNLRAVLGLTDRNAMAHSVEARVPYVDRRVVELAFSLPDHFKVGGGERKRILRRVGARRLPPGIVKRTARIGFGAPARHWLMRHFATELRALADETSFRESTLVDRGVLRSFIDAFLSGRNADAGTAWRLLAIDQWVRIYAVKGL
jgi:asparagine synthase (glutamine-hydrolysing)